jgi:DNA polymerase III subunit epsilon
MDFIAIDFEIANPNYASVCAAGWATVRDGMVVERGSWLCRPPSGHEEFGLHNVRIHKITADRVADQPSFAERVPDLLARFGDALPIVAHNAAFDINVLRQALAACGRTRPQNPYHCTKEWSKRLLDLPKYKLTAVCKHLGIQLEQHHEAGSDALAAARIALRLAEMAGVSTVDELAFAAKCGRVIG